MSSLLCQHAIIARGSLSIVLTALHDHYVWNIHLWWRRTFNWSNSCSLYITISLVSTNCAIFVLFYGLFKFVCFVYILQKRQPGSDKCSFTEEVIAANNDTKWSWLKTCSSQTHLISRSFFFGFELIERAYSLDVVTRRYFQSQWAQVSDWLLYRIHIIS